MLQQIINIVACDGQVVFYFNFTLFSVMSNIHKVCVFFCLLYHKIYNYTSSGVIPCKSSLQCLPASFP